MNLLPKYAHYALVIQAFLPNVGRRKGQKVGLRVVGYKAVHRIFPYFRVLFRNGATSDQFSKYDNDLHRD